MNKDNNTAKVLDTCAATILEVIVKYQKKEMTKENAIEELKKILPKIKAINFGTELLQTFGHDHLYGDIVITCKKANSQNDQNECFETLVEEVYKICEIVKKCTKLQMSPNFQKAAREALQVYNLNKQEIEKFADGIIEEDKTREEEDD